MPPLDSPLEPTDPVDHATPSPDLADLELSEDEIELAYQRALAAFADHELPDAPEDENPDPTRTPPQSDCSPTPADNSEFVAETAADQIADIQFVDDEFVDDGFVDDGFVDDEFTGNPDAHAAAEGDLSETTADVDPEPDGEEFAEETDTGESPGWSDTPASVSHAPALEPDSDAESGPFALATEFDEHDREHDQEQNQPGATLDASPDHADPVDPTDSWEAGAYADAAHTARDPHHTQSAFIGADEPAESDDAIEPGWRAFGEQEPVDFLPATAESDGVDDASESAVGNLDEPVAVESDGESLRDFDQGCNQGFDQGFDPNFDPELTQDPVREEEPEADPDAELTAEPHAEFDTQFDGDPNSPLEGEPDTNALPDPPAHLHSEEPIDGAFEDQFATEHDAEYDPEHDAATAAFDADVFEQPPAGDEVHDPVHPETAACDDATPTGDDAGEPDAVGVSAVETDEPPAAHPPAVTDLLDLPLPDLAQLEAELVAAGVELPPADPLEGADSNTDNSPPDQASAADLSTNPPGTGGLETGRLGPAEANVGQPLAALATAGLAQAVAAQTDSAEPRSEPQSPRSSRRAASPPAAPPPAEPQITWRADAPHGQQGSGIRGPRGVSAEKFVPPPPTSAENITPGQVIEAALFVGGGPLSAGKLYALLRGTIALDDVPELIDELNRLYASQSRPYEIRLKDGGYVLDLCSDYEKLRHRVFGQGPREVRLTQEQLEVLALVAYRQPISEAGIAELGRPESGSILRQLLRRELVGLERAEQDRKDVRYHTTERFLSVFGLASLDELPQPEDLAAR